MTYYLTNVLGTSQQVTMLQTHLISHSLTYLKHKLNNEPMMFHFLAYKKCLFFML
jgi:hypothetical protein